MSANNLPRTEPEEEEHGAREPSGRGFPRERARGRSSFCDATPPPNPRPRQRRGPSRLVRPLPPPPMPGRELMTGLGVSRTGLMTAVAARHVAMAKLLLAHGADPHRRSPTDGMHALHVLAEQGPRDFSSTDSVRPLHPLVRHDEAIAACVRVCVWHALSVCVRACTT
jgi:hypothetical protein